MLAAFGVTADVTELSRFGGVAAAFEAVGSDDWRWFRVRLRSSVRASVVLGQVGVGVCTVGEDADRRFDDLSDQVVPEVECLSERMG